MMQNLLVKLRIRKAPRYAFLRDNAAYLAPIAGVLPALGWLAYHNRERIKSAYRSRIAPKFSRGGSMRTMPSVQSAAM